MSLNDLNETQSKFILERIHQTEKNAAHLHEAFSVLARKQSKVRDRFDKLAHVTKSMSDTEKLNPTSCEAFSCLAVGFTHLADSQDEAIDATTEKILQDLAEYQTICQNSRDEVKNQVTLRDKEFGKRKQLEANQKFKNENDVMNSNMQIAKILKEITSISEQFETQKVGDFKEIFQNFIEIQMRYHAECLEVLTELHGHVDGIDVAQDTQSSMDKLRKINRQIKKRIQQDTSMSSGFFLSRFKSQSLGALTSILDNSKKPSSSSSRDKGISKRFLARRNLNQSTMSMNSMDSTNTDELPTKKDESHAMDLSADSLETKEDSTEESEESESESEPSEEVIVEAKKPPQKVQKVKQTRFQP